MAWNCQHFGTRNLNQKRNFNLEDQDLANKCIGEISLKEWELILNEFEDYNYYDRFCIQEDNLFDQRSPEFNIGTVSYKTR